MKTDLDQTLSELFSAAYVDTKALVGKLDFPSDVERLKALTLLQAAYYGRNSQEYVSCLSKLAGTLLEQLNLSEAEAHARELVQICRGLRLYVELSSGLSILGQVKQILRESSDAETLYREAVDVFRAKVGATHPDYSVHLNNLAGALDQLDRLEEAETLYREAVEIGRNTIGEEHPDYADRLNSLSIVLHEQGRYPEAERLDREALEITRNALGDADFDYGRRLGKLASVVKAQGRYPEAEGLYREALQITLATFGETHIYYALDLSTLGDLLSKVGKVAEGREMLSQALQIFRASLPPEHPYIAGSERRLDALPPD